MNMQCKKCGDKCDHMIQGLDEKYFPVCKPCQLKLDVLLEALPFPASAVEPGSDLEQICSVVVNTFFDTPPVPSPRNEGEILEVDVYTWPDRTKVKGREFVGSFIAGYVLLSYLSFNNPQFLFVGSEMHV